MNICWFCGKEIEDKENGIEFSWEFDTFFHIHCLENACENHEEYDEELPLIVEEMNEKGYDFDLGGDKPENDCYF